MEANLSNVQASVILTVVFIFLIISAVCTIIMLISIFKKGDERRKYILAKTCTHTFLICAGILLVDVIYTLFFEKYTCFSVGSKPILYLGAVAIVFTISLFMNKRRYGN